MKAGCRPVYTGARAGVVPEYPVYWEVTPDIEPAVALLVEGGQIEYEPNISRAGNGTFSVAPELQLQTVVVESQDRPFARKNGRR